MTTGDEKTKGTAGSGDHAGSAIDAMEQRVLAFAEQLGRIVGTVQAKAEGWMDRDALNAQIASVRDSAADLLEQLGGGRKTAADTPRQAAGAANSGGGKSGGAKSGVPASAAKSSGAAGEGARTGSAKTTGGASAKPAPAKPSAKGKVASKMGASATSGALGKGAGKGRSGGAVDAPGKKHRKPMPSEAAATGSPRGAGSRIAKLKLANEARVRRKNS